MAKQTINIGSAANDGTGSTLRESFDITNDNFTELYDGTGGLFHKIEGANFTGSLLIGHATTGTLSSAQNNTGIGIGALDALTTGDNNIAIGQNAGTLINSGTENVFIGQASGDALTTGNYNVAIGHETLSNEDTHGGNTAIGHLALRSLNAGVDAYNIAVGYLAGLSLTTGKENVIIGAVAGDALTTGVRNVAIGHAALSAEDEHGGNVAIGYQSLLAQDAGDNAYNTAIGYRAGKSISTGVKNIIIGGLGGDSLTTGSNNIIIGYNAAASAVDVSNEVTIGDSNIANVRIPSDSTLKIGASGDLQLEHLSGNSFIKNTDTGDLYIENQVDDANIIFRCDDGSGGLDTYFSVVGAGNRVQYNKNLRLIDNAVASFGSDDDLQIYHSGASSSIRNQTGDLYIQNFADDSDIVFQSDDGSGGVAEYFRVDGGAVKTIASKNFAFLDSIKAEFGDSGDLTIYHNGTNSLIENSTGHLYIKNSGVDKDIIFEGDNGSGGVLEYFKLDGSLASGGSVFTRFPDNSNLGFGNNADLTILHDSNHSYIKNYTGDLYIENFGDDKDIIFKSDDGSGGTTEYFRLDGGDGINYFFKDIKFLDDGRIKFGTSSDLQIYHNGTNSLIENSTGDFYISNKHDDGNIQFYCDDGSGGTAQYFRLDGGLVETSFLKTTHHYDNVKANFGDGEDLQIYHDGSNSYISDEGTGNLFIQASNSLNLRSTSGEWYMDGIANGAVNLYYDNVKKFETTSAGVTVTGNLLNSGYIYVNTGGAEPSASQVGVRITGTQGQAFWNSANSGTTGYNHFNFYNANGVVGSIVTNGSATAFNTSSDYRLKEDLKDFDGLDKVSKIPVYDFKWKVDDSRSYGVMAHELQKVLPDAVSGEKDAEEMQGVDYSKIVPLLIKSIQELEARVKTLENK